MAKYNATNRPIARLALGRAELAIAVGVSTATVDQMVEEGALPRPRKWHSRKLWLVSDVEAFLNEWPTDGEADRPDYKAVAPHNSYVKDEPALEARPSPASNKSDPVMEWYRRIGFDPTTMNQDDFMRLWKAKKDEWKASIPGTPIGKREANALKQLAVAGVGIEINSGDVKRCGDDTQDRLEARGFIEVRPNPKSEQHPPIYVLTEAGWAAWQEISISTAQSGQP